MIAPPSLAVNLKALFAPSGFLDTPPKFKSPTTKLLGTKGKDFEDCAGAGCGGLFSTLFLGDLLTGLSAAAGVTFLLSLSMAALQCVHAMLVALDFNFYFNRVT